jgi:hypothetical protein
VDSEREEAKKKALKDVADEMANQPKQDGEGTEESKEKRADAEKRVAEQRDKPPSER